MVKKVIASEVSFGYEQKPAFYAMVSVFEGTTSEIIRRRLGLLSTQCASDYL